MTHGLVDSQGVVHRIAPGSAIEAIEESTGQVHLISLQLVKEKQNKESEALTFTAYRFEYRCVLCDSYVSKYMCRAAKSKISYLLQ